MSFIDNLINNVIRPEVIEDIPYVVQDSAGYIKLDAMENPYALPRDLREQLGRRLADAVMNRYPLGGYAALKAKVRAKMGVPPGYDVILGNGSDELISIMASAVARQDRRTVILAPTPGFVMFERSAMIANCHFVGVPLGQDLGLDMPAMLAAIAEHKPALVFLAYPNNPTGNLYNPDDMVRIIEAVGDSGIVVVDEAYGPFARTSFMPRLPEFPNMVVMRTLSKLGLAGIRLGYLSCDARLLAHFEKMRPPYNVNVLTEVAADFALDNLHVLDQQAATLIAAREQLAADLNALPGVSVFPSAANFLLVKVPDATRACEKLLDAKVLIKNVSKMHPLLANSIRVTVSTPEENAAFLNAIKASL
jgi:histidinol-phosphate aminotransferase